MLGYQTVLNHSEEVEEEEWKRRRRRRRKKRKKRQKGVEDAKKDERQKETKWKIWFTLRWVLDGCMGWRPRRFWMEGWVLGGLWVVNCEGTILVMGGRIGGYHKGFI